MSQSDWADVLQAIDTKPTKFCIDKDGNTVELSAWDLRVPAGSTIEIEFAKMCAEILQDLEQSGNIITVMPEFFVPMALDAMMTTQEMVCFVENMPKNREIFPHFIVITDGEDLSPEERQKRQGEVKEALQK